MKNQDGRSSLAQLTMMSTSGNSSIGHGGSVRGQRTYNPTRRTWSGATTTRPGVRMGTDQCILGEAQSSAGDYTVSRKLDRRVSSLPSVPRPSRVRQR
jgi:hypothetical protein